MEATSVLLFLLTHGKNVLSSARLILNATLLLFLMKYLETYQGGIRVISRMLFLQRVPWLALSLA